MMMMIAQYGPSLAETAMITQYDPSLFMAAAAAQWMKTEPSDGEADLVLEKVLIGCKIIKEDDAINEIECIEDEDGFSVFIVLDRPNHTTISISVNDGMVVMLEDCTDAGA